MEIRAAVEDDLAAVVELLGELHDPPDAVANLSAWDAIRAQAGRTVLVAELDGVVIGSADLLIVPNLTRGARPWMQIENVIVTESRRGQGIGHALLEEAERRARGADCYKMQLLSARHRAEAHGLYRSLGFEPRAEGLRRYL